MGINCCGWNKNNTNEKRLDGLDLNKEKQDMRPVKPWDLLNKSNWTMAEVREKRLEICNECPELLAGICKKCGCVMSAKTALENAYCPLRKW